MTQGTLKPRKNAGKSSTQRRNKPRPCMDPNKNVAVRKLRNVKSFTLTLAFLYSYFFFFQRSKLVPIGKIEKLMSSTALSNNEHLDYVHKVPSKKKAENDSVIPLE
jgi:hypothetical protein